MAPDNGDKNAIFKNIAPFTDCISETNNKEIDHAKDINKVMPMYNLMGYSDNYIKTSLEIFGNTIEMNQLHMLMALLFNVSDDPDSLSFKYKQKQVKLSCFQHEMAYGNSKDLINLTASDKILHDKAFDIAKKPKYDGYQRSLDSMVYKLFDKK